MITLTKLGVQKQTKVDGKFTLLFYHFHIHTEASKLDHKLCIVIVAMVGCLVRAT